MSRCTIPVSALAFQSVAFNIVARDGQPWLRANQIGLALEYKNPELSIAKLYRANQDEFTDRMTAVVKLGTAGGAQDVRIFSLRGAHLLGMFARTAKAAEFRRWVLDVLDREIERPAATVMPPPKRSREELSFTRRDDQGRLVNWSVDPRERLWADGLKRGEAFFREVAELAGQNEQEAYHAVQFAFIGEWASAPDGSSQWNNRGAGEEMGFADAVARAVIDGLRARRSGTEPFDPEQKTGKGRAIGKPNTTRALPPVMMPPTQQRLLA